MAIIIFILILIAVAALIVFVWTALNGPDKPNLEAWNKNYFVPLNGKPKQKGILPPQAARMFGVIAEFSPKGTTINLNAPCWITGQKKSMCGCKECLKARKAAGS